MSFIKSKSSGSNSSVKVFYQEYGKGKPVVFIHGWPLNHEMWEYQLAELPKHNLRCITYDRRGFGKSDRPWEGYDYTTLADDLNELITQLHLSEVTLVGFSMGGGEIASYIGKYGTAKIEKVVFISSVTPFRLKTEDNPNGTDKLTFDDTIHKIEEDRPAFLIEFGKKFYGVEEKKQTVSQAMLDWNQNLCLMSSAKATVDCVRSFSETDFREDIKKITVPVLIIHGDADKTVPIEASADKTAAMLPHAKYMVYKDAPHGLFITEKEKLNADLIHFITEKNSEFKS
ncbi:alpha/beta fold hydrolase [Flavobacterium polysaccharolyticum]|uniref:Alpha/beta hydrolase n=1 Tax=Flavobacterium polysaccharolyticum TaxID=3133148 RepID=A0ABU9NRM7_9FLAO